MICTIRTFNPPTPSKKGDSFSGNEAGTIKKKKSPGGEKRHHWLARRKKYSQIRSAECRNPGPGGRAPTCGSAYPGPDPSGLSG